MTGEPIAAVKLASAKVYDQIVDRAAQAFQRWRTVPPPARGEVVRQIGPALRRHKADLGLLITSRRARSAPRAWARCRR